MTFKAPPVARWLKLLILAAGAGLLVTVLPAARAAAQQAAPAESDRNGNWVATWGASPVAGVKPPFQMRYEKEGTPAAQP